MKKALLVLAILFGSIFLGWKWLGTFNLDLHRDLTTENPA